METKDNKRYFIGVMIPAKTFFDNLDSFCVQHATLCFEPYYNNSGRGMAMPLVEINTWNDVFRRLDRGLKKSSRQIAYFMTNLNRCFTCNNWRKRQDILSTA